MIIVVISLEEQGYVTTVLINMYCEIKI